VDIGAHHPYRLSNTAIFYKKGWHGVNIDAMPGSMIRFSKKRKRDINLEIGISKTEGALNYYVFNEPALNTFSRQEAEKKEQEVGVNIERTEKIFTMPLSKVFSKYLSIDQKIDFLSIDVEGLDLEVIQSNNWKIYRPTLVLVEDLKRPNLLELLEVSEIVKFMYQLNYVPIARTWNTLIFEASEGRNDK